MKKVSLKIFSIILICTMVLTNVTMVFAEEYYIEEGNGTIEEIQVAKDIYFSLSPEAKKIFDQEISRDKELLGFHKKYVDENFIVEEAIQGSFERSSSPMTILSAQLSALGLPSAVLYSLKAMGAGMVAAIADGPLPIGDILLAAASASAAIVIAANWNTVSSKWNQIIAAFKMAFAKSASNVLSAFTSIKKDVSKELEVNPSVTISGREVTINGVKYNCNTEADSLTEKQKRNQKYFPALLYGNTVLVDPLHPLDGKQAKIFVNANSKRVGIWATNSVYARGLCGGNNAIWHNRHDSSEGYFYHYHHPVKRNFHCWYL